MRSEIDTIDRDILFELQQDARLSMAELGRRVRLSPPAVAERVRRLERTGVITGYGARVSLKAVGRPVLAFIRISAVKNVKEEAAGIARNAAEVLECHRGSGSDCVILKVAVCDLEQLERTIDLFIHLGQVTVTIVLSSPIADRSITPA